VSPKVAFSAILCVAAGMASAQSVNLHFPADGPRQVWVSPERPTTPPGDADGIFTMKSDATLSVAGQSESAVVYVWDKTSGNLASKNVKDAGTTTWTLRPTDFQDIAVVSVQVDHLGKPVAAATVDLDDGRGKSTQLLDPSSKGAVTFFDVKPGSLKVTVHYKVSGKDVPPITQLFDVALTHPDAIPAVHISLADAVETAGQSAAMNSTASGAGPQTSAGSSAGGSAASGASKDGGGFGSFLGTLLIYLLVLGGMGALIYYAMQYMKKNPDSVGSKLEQLGVQIPKPGDDPLTNPAPIPLPKAPAPVQKIILTDSAPDLIAPMAASTLVSDPRLVSQTGDSMPLPEGDLIVGRDVGLGLSLVGESTVSRKHAQLTRTGGTVTVKDFGSTNGTFVNGVQVQGEMQLQIGDTVQFGSVRFRFQG